MSQYDVTLKKNISEQTNIQQQQKILKGIFRVKCVGLKLICSLYYFYVKLAILGQNVGENNCWRHQVIFPRNDELHG